MMEQLIMLQQAFRPGKPLDFPILPRQSRIMIRATSQFDGNFARAFVDGSAGEGFDHTETLARIQQPVLFLHGHYVMRDGRLLGALDDADVARAAALVRGPWRYVRMDCGHAIPLQAPEQEASEILAWVNEVVSPNRRIQDSDMPQRSGSPPPEVDPSVSSAAPNS
jgi:pimeloyl-ACP methyl ester carboxylesterase